MIENGNELGNDLLASGYFLMAIVVMVENPVSVAPSCQI